MAAKNDTGKLELKGKYFVYESMQRKMAWRLEVIRVFKESFDDGL